MCHKHTIQRLGKPQPPRCFNMSEQVVYPTYSSILVSSFTLQSFLIFKIPIPLPIAHSLVEIVATSV